MKQSTALTTTDELSVPEEFMEYTDAQLLSVIKHLVTNLQGMASVLDQARPDIAMCLDQIVDGATEPNQIFTLANVHEAGRVGGYVIYMDRNTYKMVIVEHESGKVVKESPAINTDIANKRIKRMRES